MFQRSRSYRVFNILNYLFLIVLAILCILPLLHVFAVSMSSRAAATASIVNFWPVGFTLDAYENTLQNKQFLTSLWIGMKRTVLGTAVSMTVITLAAYSLSKTNERFPGRHIYTWLFVFTMLFNGGLIPMYIVVTKIGLTNSLGALVFPVAVNVWNMILMLNFFRALPKDLEEAALIDGAGHISVLCRVYLPISMPAVATLSLFAMVFHWNSWLDGVIYMTNTKYYPLASFLHAMVVELSIDNVSKENIANISNRTIRSSQIFIGALPILLVYPFLQRYFVKGIVLGSVKE